MSISSSAGSSFPGVESISSISSPELFESSPISAVFISTLFDIAGSTTLNAIFTSLYAGPVIVFLSNAGIKLSLPSFASSASFDKYSVYTYVPLGANCHSYSIFISCVGSNSSPSGISSLTTEAYPSI